MSSINDDLAYFKGVLPEPDADSLPLADAQAQEDGFDEALLRHVLPAGLMRDLAGHAQKNGLELATLFDAAAMLAFAEYSGSADVLCALVRGGKRLPVYCNTERETSFLACYSAVKKQAEEAARRDGADFDTLCAELGLSEMPTLAEDEESFRSFSLMGAGPKTPLCLFFDLKAGALCAKYNAALYGEGTVGRLLNSLTSALRSIADGEDAAAAISMLSDEQRAELDAFNETDSPYDAGETLIDRIDRTAERFPNNIAVVFKDKRCTYRAFADLTDKIAAKIRREGIGREDAVSILIPRCEYMPICAVGVLKAGAAYQPLDPSYPPERLQFMMRDAGAKLLIADKSLLSLVPEYGGPVLTLDEIPELPACEETLPPPQAGGSVYPALHLRLHRHAQRRHARARQFGGILQLVHRVLQNGRKQPRSGLCVLWL